ncbi:hypothetical protein VRK_14150 [Vibrio sp. MEBiC08052]|nr:hypothetical protein VRK_14150 [Vibrio sp. MEBiC08052]
MKNSSGMMRSEIGYPVMFVTLCLCLVNGYLSVEPITF